MTPHPPQLLLSVWVFTQEVPHFVVPPPHCNEHTPFEQNSLMPQTFPQPLQCKRFDLMLTHCSEFVGPQNAKSEPPGHLQEPLWQVCPPEHVVPHPPQLLLSVCVFTQEVPHLVGVVPPQLSEHVPLEQNSPAPHAVPQPLVPQ